MQITRTHLETQRAALVQQRANHLADAAAASGGIQIVDGLLAMLGAPEPIQAATPDASPSDSQPANPEQS